MALFETIYLPYESYYISMKNSLKFSHAVLNTATVFGIVSSGKADSTQHLQKLPEKEARHAGFSDGAPFQVWRM